jgi:hypothetical protein
MSDAERAECEPERRREYGTIEKDLSSVVDQVQSLVNRFHEMAMQISRLADRVPEGLARRLVVIDVELKNLADTLSKQYVSRDDFIELRTEHRTVTRLVYGFVGVILMAVVVALVALVVKR